MTKKKRKLIDILLDNITPEDWPESLPLAAQDKRNGSFDLFVWFYKKEPKCTHGEVYSRWSATPMSRESQQSKIKLPELCKNWNKTIVTRDEFVKRWNERNSRDDKKPDADGWITWNGGEMPVEKGTLIDVKYRDGVVNLHVKAGEIPSCGSINRRCAICFKHANYPGDIVAYRIHSKTNTTTPPARQESHTKETKPIQQEVKATDTQIGGNHYTKLAIQPMRYSMENGLDALQHTVIKYVTRFRDKNGIEDLEKAKHCIDMLIEFERGKK